MTTAEELRGAGLRVTASRVAMLETVRGGDHLGVEAIAFGVRERIGHVSLQAVYEAGALPDRIRRPRLLRQRGRGRLLGPVPWLFR